jgi:hypothetical protein
MVGRSWGIAMRRIGKLLAGAAVLVAATGSAFAADVVIIPPPAPLPPPPVAEALFDGPYWGVYGGIWNGAVQQRITPLVGTQFGYNFVFGSVMTGFEVETEYLRTRTVVEATLSSRLGFLLGTNVLLYGQVGIGTFYGSIPHWSLGGGVEVALGSSGLALFAEAKRLWRIGGPNILAWTVRGGLNYYADGDNAGPGGAFDWGGLYFGAHGGRVTGNVMPAAGPWLGGIQVGYNLGGAGFVGGAEVETSYTFGNNAWINAALNGRGGAAFGNFLIYGEVGIGSYNWIAVWTAGGGVELALGDRIGLFGEGKAMFRLGGGGGVDGVQINTGLNIHFGR